MQNNGVSIISGAGAAICSAGMPKKARHAKSKVKSMLIIFFDIKWIDPK
jgi:hypothetical protein